MCDGGYELAGSEGSYSAGSIDGCPDQTILDGKMRTLNENDDDDDDDDDVDDDIVPRCKH